jgi:hypothetical protein
MLDLIQELEYRVSGFEESKDLTLLHFELLIWPGPLDRGRLIAIDLPLRGGGGGGTSEITEFRGFERERKRHRIMISRIAKSR